MAVSLLVDAELGSRVSEDKSSSSLGRCEPLDLRLRFSEGLASRLFVKVRCLFRFFDANMLVL